MKKNKVTSTYFKKGSYSVGLTAVVLAVVIVINLIAAQLPASIKNIDISSTDIYSISDTTTKILDNLDKKVEIVVLAESANIDARISRFLDIYKNKSKDITIKKVDPVQHPTALNTYNAEANSIVVTCEETNKSKVISMDDIIQYDQSYYYYYGQKKETAFDGEGQITSAIDYVTGENNHKIYTTTGHGETSLASTVTDALEKQNFTSDSVNLLMDGGIPDDCDLLLINGITKDLAEDELTMLRDYLAKGGNVYVLLGDIQVDTPNLDTLLSDNNLQIADGYIADTSRYYQNDPYTFFPVGDTSSEQLDGIESNNYALIYATLGLTQIKEDSDEVDAFLNTSASGYAVTDSAKKQGTYILGARVDKNVQSTTNGDAVTSGDATTSGDANGTVSHFTVLASSNFIAENLLTNFSNLANIDIFMNTITSNFDDVENISIPTKSLEMQMNTVATGGLFGILFIIVIPLGMLICGFIVWRKRRKA